MIEIKKVRGSKESSSPLIIGKTTVYVHTNIHEIEEPIINPETGEPTEETYTEYEYDEKQYSLAEWAALQAELNQGNIDYLSMMSGIDLEEG